MSRRAWLGLLAATLLLAVVVSGFASTNPDGLERVAEEHGLANTQETEQTSVFGYESPVARVLGVVAVLIVAGGLTLALRRRREE